ncbi:type I-F CRISPR-associated protein Csy2 [Paludibacterium paludis]|uniref:Type I-F CRISPR-associated protein Csy2 n=1 Tax=Paludibacterium paludis TaxID=1225769 RepID=A0A918UBK6_9NEIS|nr:type I-F CRISPR-associated protein Csy2 [Paludibacterium paludis]GGY23822.1 type I-F CRISPR-associated protein Csy2 [Paludibacterium paludis]
MRVNPISNVRGLLILPHLRVQNANAISGQHTWGFPAITAFTGQMTGLERKLGRDIGLEFYGVGVICHDHQAQTSGDYVQRFNLTRNPVDKNGDTAAIVEEGRIHLDITLVFGVGGEALSRDDEALAELARHVARTLETMRIAGGTLIPGPYPLHPQLHPLPDDEEGIALLFRELRRRWLPGFALVARDDLLHAHHAKLRKTNEEASLLDAWLDKSRINYNPQQTKSGETEWTGSRQPGDGWIVPIPVGFGAISPLQPGGSVSHARDSTTPFRFVESLYSLGEWLSPHRLTHHAELLWYPSHDPETGVYRCRNDYRIDHHAALDNLGELA